MRLLPKENLLSFVSEIHKHSTNSLDKLACSPNREKTTLFPLFVFNSLVAKFLVDDWYKLLWISIEQFCPDELTC